LTDLTEISLENLSRSNFQYLSKLISTFMKRAIFFVLLITVSLISRSQNLLINPGFETWDKVNKPAGWSHIENCLKDSSVFNSGKYACMHSGGATTTSDLGQTVSVTPGKTYALSIYYRTAVSSSGNGGRIWCYWKDAGGNSISDPSSDAILRPSKYLKSDSWQFFSISVTSPAQAAYFYLEVRAYSNSMVYWDDFIFEETLTTGVSESLFSQPFIYPNPASNNLTVSNISDLKSIDIQSLSGTTVWSSEFSGETEVIIPVAGLPDGLYIIRIHSSGKTIIRKFLKN
jgi:hypothetical protein